MKKRIPLQFSLDSFDPEIAYQALTGAYCRQSCDQLGIDHDLQQAMLAADKEIRHSDAYLRAWFEKTKEQLNSIRVKKNFDASLIAALLPETVKEITVSREWWKETSKSVSPDIPNGYLNGVFSYDGSLVAAHWSSWHFQDGISTSKLHANRLVARELWTLPVIEPGQPAPWTRMVGRVVTWGGASYVLGEPIDFSTVLETAEERQARIVVQVKAVDIAVRKKPPTKPVFPSCVTNPQPGVLNLFGLVEHAKGALT